MAQLDLDNMKKSFMNKLIDKFRTVVTVHKGKEYNLSEATINNYMNQLFRLNDRKEFPNFAFLKKHDIIDEKIKKYSNPGTAKSYYAAIMKALRTMNQKIYKSDLDYYTMQFNPLAVIVANVDTSKMTEKQEKNWMNINEINKLKDKMEEIAKSHYKFESRGKFTAIRNYMLLLLYTEFMPRRNLDYNIMKVVTTKKDIKDKINFNYISIKDKKMYFFKHKTSNRYPEYILDYSTNKRFQRALAMYLVELHLDIRVINPEHYFILSKNGNPLKNSAEMTNILNEIFGKKIGATMLRHIVASYQTDIEKIKNNAAGMAHNVGEHLRYLKSVN